MKEINAVTLDSAAYIAGQMESIKPSNKGSASFDSFMDISTKVKAMYRQMSSQNRILQGQYR